jgi:hypothetical protein
VSKVVITTKQALRIVLGRPVTPDTPLKLDRSTLSDEENADLDQTGGIEIAPERTKAEIAAEARAQAEAAAKAEADAKAAADAAAKKAAPDAAPAAKAPAKK